MKNRIISISLAVVLILSVGLIGCGGDGLPEVTEYNLTISSTEGGLVTAPGEGTFTYNEGEKVNLAAIPDDGYQFANWTGDVGEIADVEDSTTTITMQGDYSVTANFAIKQYSLIIHSTEGGSVTTPGESAYTYDRGEVVNLVAVVDDGYVFINWTGDVGTIADVNAASTTIAMNGGYSITANFAGAIRDWYDLDAIRDNLDGSYVLMNDLDPATPGYGELASETANGGKGWQPIGTWDDRFVGSFDGQGFEIRDLFVYRPDETCVALFAHIDSGAVVENLGVVNSRLTGNDRVGSLVGRNWGTVENCYFTGIIEGKLYGGALVGEQIGTVRNSYYDYGDVVINGETIITVGALFREDFEQWLVNGRFLDVNERLAEQHGYYLIDDVSDFKQLLAFGQDSLLKFRLTADLDLGDEPNLYIPYLAGEFDGAGHKIANLNFRSDFASSVALFGHLAPGGSISELGAENVNVASAMRVGGLVGANAGGTVTDSSCTGSVTGGWSVGGLIGDNGGTVSDSYSSTRVNGEEKAGGLVGWNHAIIDNSYYSYDDVLINGERIITVGALFQEDFEQWLTSGKSLDVNEKLSQENGYYLINDVRDFKQLLAFGQNDALKFRLTNDLDLSSDPDLYIPYLGGEFDGSGHKIRNLRCHFDCVAYVGLFGYLAPGGRISGLAVENVDLAGYSDVGGLLGENNGGTVSSSYSTGSVAGDWSVGGLMGTNGGTMSNSYSITCVTGGGYIGGIVGFNSGAVNECFSAGEVTGGESVGGLVGWNYGGTVSTSFWDTETSGQATSDGGAGKTTAEMKNIATFSGAGWSITAVAPGERNTAYTWNIIDGQTYPFLSWQP